MVLSVEQNWNAYAPMCVNEVGSLASNAISQPRKARSPIVVTPAGTLMIIGVNVAQPCGAPSTLVESSDTVATTIMFVIDHIQTNFQRLDKCERVSRSFRQTCAQTSTSSTQACEF
eukprot:m.14769 g.14769  ORF g.14769 m.14769 type:complete len:116 (+) comp10279_c0_seq1:509-856(+)